MDIDSGTTAAPAATPCADTRTGTKRPREDVGDGSQGGAGAAEIPCEQRQQQHQQRQSLQQPATSMDVSGGTPAPACIAEGSKRCHLFPSTTESIPAAGTGEATRSTPVAAASAAPAGSPPAAAAQSVPVDPAAGGGAAAAAADTVAVERQSTSTPAADGSGAGADVETVNQKPASSPSDGAAIPTLPIKAAAGDGDGDGGTKSTAAEGESAASAAPAEVTVEKCQVGGHGRPVFLAVLLCCGRII